MFFVCICSTFFMGETEHRGRDGRPCKACFSFEDLLRMAGKQKAAKDKQQQKAGDESVSTSSSTTTTEPKIGDDVQLQQESTSSGARRSDCPVDKDQLGRYTWALLHTMSVYYPDEPTKQQQRDMGETIAGISKTYPCEHCAADFRDDLRAHPPALCSRSVLARWMCEAHNRVNAKLGKRAFNCDSVMERWYDGWKDGSCD